MRWVTVDDLTHSRTTTIGSAWSARIEVTWIDLLLVSGAHSIDIMTGEDYDYASVSPSQGVEARVGLG